MTFKELVNKNKDIIKCFDGLWVTPGYLPFFEDDKKHMIVNVSEKEPVFDEELNNFLVENFSVDSFEVVVLYNDGEDIIIDDIDDIRNLKVYIGD